MIKEELLFFLYYILPFALLLLIISSKNDFLMTCIFLCFIILLICYFIGKIWELIIFYIKADFKFKILILRVTFVFFIFLVIFFNIFSSYFLEPIEYPSPLPPLSSSVKSEISKIFESLPQGLFVYSCSKEMTVGIPETCTARIANDKYLSIFRKAINKGLNPQYIEEIKLQYVNSIMSVKLTGKNFEIELKGNAEDQVIEDRSFSSWQWDVTPTEAGMQKLDFIVSVILRVPGYEELLPKHFEANTIEVSVKVNPSFSLKFFMRQNWKYLTATIFVLLYFTVSWFTETKKREATMVNEGDTYNIGQAGAVGKFASSHKNTFVQSEQKVTLAEAAAEIQKLLKQLETDNPTATEREKIDYVNVQTDPDIKQRAISALKAGGETAIEEFLANPYVNVGKAII